MSPARSQTLPIGVAPLCNVSATACCCWRWAHLEYKQLVRVGSQVRHNLHRGRTGPDHPDPFPLESVEHRPVWTAAGVSVVPPRSVQHVAFVALDPWRLKRRE